MRNFKVNMNEELQKAEELLNQLKGVANEEFEKVKKNPVKSAVRIVIFLWVLQKLWKSLDKKNK